MLHPRDSHDQKVVQADLKISPEPTSLRFVQDAFGNYVGIAQFSRRSKELSFGRVPCASSIRPVRPLSISNTPDGPSPSAIASASCGISLSISNAINSIRWTTLAAGLGNSCPQSGRLALSSFSHGCLRRPASRAARRLLRIVQRDCEIPRRKPRGETKRARRLDHQHGEVAATPMAEPERLHWRLDSLRFPPPVEEAVMDALCASNIQSSAWVDRITTRRTPPCCKATRVRISMPQTRRIFRKRRKPDARISSRMTCGYSTSATSCGRCCRGRSKSSR